MTTLPKYKTIEIKEFHLKQLSFDPFFGKDEYIEAVAIRQKNISEYCTDKLGKNYVNRDYPTRMTFSMPDGERVCRHIQTVYYSYDNNQRVLIVGRDDDDVNIVILQSATPNNA